jgi:hypothetical protein
VHLKTLWPPAQEPLRLQIAAKLTLQGKEGGMSSKIMLSESERASLVWRKAQRSTANGACVEIASAAGRVAIRDSKDPDGAILVYTQAEFSAFLDGARNGEFDRFTV